MYKTRFKDLSTTYFKVPPALVTFTRNSSQINLLQISGFVQFALTTGSENKNKKLQCNRN